jgi:CRP-like cAMP-binding protein
MNLSALQSLPLVSFAADHVLIEEGKPLRGIYFLETGEVAVFKNGVLIAETYQSGAALGEMAWLLGTTPMGTVKTTVPCTLRHAADPESFLRQNPEISLHLAVTLARRVDALASYLAEIKNQFRGRADHLGIIDEVLDSLMNKYPRNIVRRATGD